MVTQLTANSPDMAKSLAELEEQSNLTASQLLLWVGQKLNPDAPLYNMVFIFTIQGAIAPDHFQRAFQALVDRSDVFRLTIEEIDGIPQQRVHPSLKYALPLLDFSAEAEPQDRLRQWVRDRSTQPFDLQTRLFDSALIALVPDRWVWYLNQHHLITDIWSVKLIYQAVSSFYRHSINGTLDDAPRLPSYQDFIAQAKVKSPKVKLPNEQSRSRLYQTAAAYWQQQQLPAPVPLYGKIAAPVSPRTRRVSCELGPDRTAMLQRLAIESEARALTPQLSLFNLIAAVLFAYLYRISSSTQLAVATPAHGRPTATLKETIGVFIELFPLQTEIESGETFAI